MSRSNALTIPLAGPDDTAAAATRLAPMLGPGDCVLLTGSLGTGKTHFARAFIQSRLAEHGLYEDVPSPTFTLVQVYNDTACEIWHADLYRLADPNEVIELGLDEAFDTAITLIEWPDRLANLAPDHALRLNLETLGDARVLHAEWADPRLAEWGQENG